MYLLSHVDTPLKQFDCCIIFNLPQSKPLCNSSLFLCLFVHVFICFLLIWNRYTKYDVYTGWLLCADTSSMTIGYLSLQFIGTSCSSIAQSSSCLCVLSVCRPILYPPEYIVESWLTNLHAIKLIVVCIPNQLYLHISLIMIVPLTHPNPQILHILYALSLGIVL